jgi:polysaccharide biosynthesis transport protein
LRKLSTSKQILIVMQENLHKQLQQEKVILMSITSGLSILKRATINQNSTSASLTRYILGGAFIGIAFSIALAFILNNLENTLKSSSDLKRHFHYPPLGVVPQWVDGIKYIDESVPDSNIAEVYGMLRNNVRFCGIESPEKALLVASASQTEGKSLTTVNLSLSFALEGNTTLLISADLRRAYSHTQFKQEADLRKKFGIVEYLEGTAELNDVIYKSTFSNFSFIPTCARANNPTKLLKTERFSEMMKYAENNYDTVIIDTPAILPVVDATIFSSKVKGVLVVAHAGQTPINAIQEAINRLEHVNSPIIGIVLNRIKDLKLEYFYGYGISNYTAYKTYS